MPSGTFFSCVCRVGNFGKQVSWSPKLRIMQGQGGGVGTGVGTAKATCKLLL